MLPGPDKFTIGSDPDELRSWIRTRIWRRPSGAFAKPRLRARRSSVCRSCFVRSTSAAKRTPNYSRWRSRFRGRPPTRYGKLAGELRVVIIASLFERRAPGLYHNTAAMIGADGELPGIYRKMHIPDDPLYYEKFYFTPGDLGFLNFDTLYGRVGVLVCWDQWYPEGARLSALTRREYPVLSHGHRLASFRESRNMGRRSWMPGAPFSARTRSPTESMWRR